MNYLSATFLEWLGGLLSHSDERVSHALTLTLALAALALVAYLGFFVAKAFLRRALESLVKKTKFTWDDHLLEAKFLFWFTQLVPGILVYACAPMVLKGEPGWISFIQSASTVYMLVVGYLALLALLNASLEIYRTFPISREIPIRGFIQVAKIFLTIMLVVITISVLMHKNPLIFLSGLGALTAVLMLIFKDSILGLVAGIQLAANRMVARGDWIEMPKFGAAGTVLDVALTTVKVQNFDHAITTVPTYALISDSFKNWRGMQESGGRRIKRALHIDVSSIAFANKSMLENWRKIALLQPYLEKKQKELDEHNQAKTEQANLDDSLANGRRLTNVGTFRAYIEAYVRNHPMIAQNLTLLIRQLAPTEDGLPIELYIFSKDRNWVNYEGIQADIFDHLFAVLPVFQLRAFQRPAGADLRSAVLAAAKTRKRKANP